MNQKRLFLFLFGITFLIGIFSFASSACPGYDDGTYCWISGASGQSCDGACSDEGSSCVSPPADDNSLCFITSFLIGGCDFCTEGSMSIPYAPGYNLIGGNNCNYLGPAPSSCSLSNAGYYRTCSCDRGVFANSIIVTIGSPENITYETFSVMINGTVDASSNVTYSLDGEANQTACNSCTSFSNTSSSLSDGLHNVSVYAIKADNASVTSSNSVYFTINTSSFYKTNHTSCDPLYSSGYHILSSSVNISNSTCFNISVDNLILDCQGFSIVGNNYSGSYGIFSNKTNTTIKNCNISNFSIGVYFNNSNNSKIETTNISGYLDGLRVIDSNFFNLTDSLFDLKLDSIYLSGSNNSYLGEVTSSSGSKRAIYSINSNHLQIVKSNFSANNSLIKSTANFLNSVNLSFSNSSFYAHDPNVTAIGSLYLQGISNSAFQDLEVVSEYYVGIWDELSNNNSWIRINSTGKEDALYSSSSYNSSFLDSNFTVSGGSWGALMLDGNTSYYSISNTKIKSLSGVNSKALVIGTTSSYNSFNNCSFISEESWGIYYYSSGTNKFNNSITNSNITSGKAGIEGYNFENFYLENVNITSGLRGIYLINSDNLSANNLYILSNNDSAILLESSANFEIANNTFTSNSSDNNYTIYFRSNSDNGFFYNNSLISLNGEGNLLGVDSSSSNITFYWNNFTNTSGMYINDSNENNFYNATINDLSVGNFWYNVLNESVVISGGSSSIFENYYYGSSGSGYPYNNSNSLGKVSLGVIDWAPLHYVAPISFSVETDPSIPSTGGSSCYFFVYEKDFLNGISKKLLKDCKVNLFFKNSSYLFDLENINFENESISFVLSNGDFVLKNSFSEELKIDFENKSYVLYLKILSFENSHL
ncbi:MAG: right-handed parallel beta-helix repeat-containing protein, partial [Nanoarchaeota archaeon]|nr:right-handed parallel beta-helix repeat-containing protein [Nanoarchaeota archaeon]